jgi:hypothetical protein
MVQNGERVGWGWHVNTLLGIAEGRLTNEPRGNKATALGQRLNLEV